MDDPTNGASRAFFDCPDWCEVDHGPHYAEELERMEHWRREALSVLADPVQLAAWEAQHGHAPDPDHDIGGKDQYSHERVVGTLHLSGAAAADPRDVGRPAGTVWLCLERFVSEAEVLVRIADGQDRLSEGIAPGEARRLAQLLLETADMIEGLPTGGG